MKAAKIILIIVLVLALGAYGYYSHLAYKIYKNIDKYERSDNKIAVDLTKQVIKEKYPYSIHYFVVLN